MTTPIPAMCSVRNCIWYLGSVGPTFDPTHVCEAFPLGIPQEVVNGVNLHNTPITGDEGIVFKPAGVQMKHLPGRHDQQTHTPRIYVGGTPATVDWVLDSGVLDTLPKDSELRRTVIDAVQRYGITQEELTDLQGFSSDAPPGYEMNKRGYYTWTGWGATSASEEEEDILGVYNPQARMVHIPEILAFRSDGPKVVLHEIGHHVAESAPNTRNKERIAHYAIGKLLDAHALEGELSGYGLRLYSLTSPPEFLADSYMVFKTGNVSQRRNLDNLYGEVGMVGGVESVLKQMVAVQELQSRVREGMSELIAIAVQVSEQVLDSTPWYYITKPEYAEKHLPGRHDQKRHDPTKGASYAKYRDIGPMFISGDSKYLDTKARDWFFDGVNAETFSDMEYDDEMDEMWERNISMAERSRWKEKVVDDLAQDTNYVHGIVNDVIGSWAKTTNDHDPRALAIQKAASEEFGVELSDWQQGRINTLLTKDETEETWMPLETRQRHFEAMRPVAAHVMQSMYENTQRSLKEADIDKVVLYRGVQGPDVPYVEKDTVVPISPNAVESWSLSYDTAYNYSGHKAPGPGLILQAEIPTERILATPKTGFGCMDEFEFIVLGRKPGTSDYAEVVWSEKGE